MRTAPLTFVLAHVILWAAVPVASAEGPIKRSPAFRELFNGKDLTGWYGLNPHEGTKLEGDAKAANLKKQREDFAKHWRVENGELVNDGHGPYANTEQEFGDIELELEYKTVAKADSGVYLRGNPQVQIWDWNQPFDPKNPHRKPHLGSGGLYNNAHGAAGRDPLVFADKPFGEWNKFHIRHVGERTWIWLNGKLVVDGAVFQNFWEKTKPMASKGPILLQTHGGEIRWRNIYVREYTSEEAKSILNPSPSEDLLAPLTQALTLHASFDTGLDADFSRGDRTAYFRQGKDATKEFVHAAASPEVAIAKEAGRFGGAVHFTKKSNFRPEYKNPGVLKYGKGPWNATVGVWLKLDPDKDLEPGYCDPVQIVGDDMKKGFVFLEWSKNENPRYFRYAVRPLFAIWNPDNVPWDEIPFAKRPMIQLDRERAGFSRERWTHVVFTLENINDKQKAPAGRLYLDGQPAGAIEKWDLSIDWDPAQVMLVLGASYVGQMDDLAVFDRVLTPEEIGLLWKLKGGVRELHPAVLKP